MDLANTKFKWVTAENPEKEYAKFILTQKDDGIPVLFVGNFTFHKDLAGAIGNTNLGESLVAAGDILPDGDITSWKSSGYAFETPLHLRFGIEGFIRNNAAEIQRNWA